MRTFAFVALLGALTALPPLSIDASLPAFPATARALGVAPGALGATLGAFMLAFALGQLLWARSRIVTAGGRSC